VMVVPSRARDERRIPASFGTELREQTDRLEPAVRLLTEVADPFLVISVWGRRWRSGDRGRSMMSAGAGASYGVIDNRSGKSAAMTVGALALARARKNH
jgi:hypothetical protein